jgi:hypothetical protein
MKQFQFYRALFGEAFQLTWRYKGWWLVGFLILLFSGSLGYQMIGQGVSSLLQPELWWSRWQTFSTQLTPTALLSGQWNLLMTDPGSWFSLLFVFFVVVVSLFVMLSIGVFALTTLISAMKLREQRGEFSFVASLREAAHHFWPSLGGVILLQIVSQALLLLFSVPVASLVLTAPGVWKSVVTGLAILVFALCSLVVALVSMYALIAIVVDDMSLGRAIVRSWRLLRRAWLASSLMMLYQFLLLFGLSVVLVVFTSLVIVPVAIIGFVLVANQQYDFTSMLPLGTFYLLMLLFAIFGAANTVFQICSWCLMYFKLTERNEAADVLVAEIRW